MIFVRTYKMKNFGEKHKRMLEISGNYKYNYIYIQPPVGKDTNLRGDRKMKLTKILAIVIAVVTCVAMLSTSVFAALDEETIVETDGAVTLTADAEEPAEVATEEVTEEAPVEEATEEVTEETPVESADLSVAPDVPADHWASEVIANLVEKGIITGDAEGNIRPGDLITREEAAKIITLAAGFAMEGSVEQFADADQISEWAAEFVAAAANAGAFTGYEDGSFGGKGNVTREQFAAVIIRAYGYGEGIGELEFADADTIGWSKGYVAKAVELGIANGYAEDNTFRPANAISRAEAFAMLTRSMKLKEALDNADAVIGDEEEVTEEIPAEETTEEVTEETPAEETTEETTEEAPVEETTEESAEEVPAEETTEEAAE